MQKFSKEAIEVIRQTGGYSHLTETLDNCLIAIAGNAGWAGLLPEAVAEKAIDTVISFYNSLSQIDEQLFPNQKK